MAYVRVYTRGMAQIGDLGGVQVSLRSFRILPDPVRRTNNVGLLVLTGRSDSSVGIGSGFLEVYRVGLGGAFVLGNVRPGFLGWVLGNFPWFDGFSGAPNEGTRHTFYMKHSTTQNYIYFTANYIYLTKN